MSWGVTGYGWAQNNLRFRFLQIQALSLIGWSFDAAHCTAIVCCISSTLLHYLTFKWYYCKALGTSMDVPKALQ